MQSQQETASRVRVSHDPSSVDVQSAPGGLKLQNAEEARIAAAQNQEEEDDGGEDTDENNNEEKRPTETHF